MSFTVAGVPSSDPLWFLHAVETTVSLHYPAGAPLAVRRELDALRKAADEMVFAGRKMAAILLAEDAEGVTQVERPAIHDDDLLPATDDEDEDDDNAGEEWKAGA
jgi:hypothetical protein